MVLKSEATDKTISETQSKSVNSSLVHELEQVNLALLLDKLNNVPFPKEFAPLDQKEVDALFSDVGVIPIKQEELSTLKTEKEFVAFLAKADNEFVDYERISRKLSLLEEYCKYKNIEAPAMGKIYDILSKKYDLVAGNVEVALKKLLEQNGRILYRGLKFGTNEEMTRYVNQLFAIPKKMTGPMMRSMPAMIEVSKSFSLREDVAKLYATFRGDGGMVNQINYLREDYRDTTSSIADYIGDSKGSKQSPALFGIVLKMDASKTKATPVCFTGDVGMAAQEAEMIPTHFFARDILEITVLEKGKVMGKFESFEEFKEYQAHTVNAS